MKRIAILRCLQSNDVCTGAACMQALHKKTGAFAMYGDEPLELEAFWCCNGCGDCKLKNQAGIEEKLARIASLQVDAVHVGVCTKHRNDMGEKVTCRKIVEICERLRAAGIKIVDGTH